MVSCLGGYAVSLDDLRGRQLALLVTVAGVTDRYYSGPAPDTQTIEGTQAGLYPRSYRDVEAVLDLGPEGGAAGGQVIATGTPEQVAATGGSHTGAFLAQVLAPAKPKRTRKAKAKAAA